jgi:hypothetical protein
MHYLFKPSIRLDEDVSALTLGTSPGEGSSVPVLQTPLGKGHTAPTSQAHPGTLGRQIGQDREPGGEIAAIVGPPSTDADWQKPIPEYLRRGTIHDDETETRHLTRRAKGYLIHNDELYCRSALDILQRCIPVEEGNALLLDIHEGVCGHHASSRSMVGKVFRLDFYWPTTTIDATQMVRSYRGCLYFVRQPHVLIQELRKIPITWPFTVWGLDLLGPFKKAPGGLTHLLVTINKFTKWTKARPLAKIGFK